MQDLIYVARNNAAVFSLFLVVTLFTLILNGCESPGSIGSDFTDPGTEVRDTVFSVTDVKTDSFTTFSGNLTRYSAGRFNDPLFGNVTATSLLKPALPASNSAVRDTLSAGTQMYLRLILDRSAIYGDTLSTAEFDLIEIDQIWRSRAWELDDEVQLSQNTVGSFSVDESTDSLEVSLDSDWVSRYRAYYNTISANRDSLYLYDFNGLAMVPANESKIIPFNPSRIRFMLADPEEEDTSLVPVSQYAYSLSRENAAAAPMGSSKAISTFEKVLTFDLDLSKEDLGTVNISKVELVFYQNDDALESSIDQVSLTAARPEATQANLFFNERKNLPDAFVNAVPISRAAYNEADGSYRFDITGFTNGVLLEGTDDSASFYITLQSNNGIVTSSLLHNEQAPEGKRPKIIVTYINTKDS